VSEGKLPTKKRGESEKLLIRLDPTSEKCRMLDADLGIRPTALSIGKKSSFLWEWKIVLKNWWCEWENEFHLDVVSHPNRQILGHCWLTS